MLLLAAKVQAGEVHATVDAAVAGAVLSVCVTVVY